MNARMTVPCADCGRSGGWAAAKGLCQTCYARVRRAKPSPERARLPRDESYDPIWGYLKPPSTPPDPKHFRNREVVE